MSSDKREQAIKDVAAAVDLFERTLYEYACLAYAVAQREAVLELREALREAGQAVDDVQPRAAIKIIRTALERSKP